MEKALKAWIYLIIFFVIATYIITFLDRPKIKSFLKKYTIVWILCVIGLHIWAFWGTNVGYALIVIIMCLIFGG